MDPSKCFTDFQHYAFRNEGLTSYKVQGEYAQYENYCKGLFAPDLSVHREWHEYLDERHSLGRNVQRLRLVPTDFQQYFWFETDWFYPVNAKKGEEIRFLSVSKLHDRLPDFWLFDDKWCVEMIYDSDGQFCESRINNDLLEQAIQFRALYWPTADPMSKFLAAERNSRRFSVE